jgi:rhodanese-related sulfurtransferase
MSVTNTIDPNISMKALLEEYPGAQRALFRTYHIGGCSSCGFAPTETLGAVCERNGQLPMDEVIQTILAAHEAEAKIQISPSEVAQRINAGEQLPLIDVRSREEWDTVHLEGSTFLTQELMHEILSSWPKDRELVFLCHHGVRSLDAASFFAGHDFQNVRVMSGGIDAWSVEIDPDVRRYHLE